MPPRAPSQVRFPHGIPPFLHRGDLYLQLPYDLEIALESLRGQEAGLVDSAGYRPLRLDVRPRFEMAPRTNQSPLWWTLFIPNVVR